MPADKTLHEMYKSVKLGVVVDRYMCASRKLFNNNIIWLLKVDQWQSLHCTLSTLNHNIITHGVKKYFRYWARAMSIYVFTRLKRQTNSALKSFFVIFGSDILSQL